MSLSIAVWGIITGWLIMPRKKSQVTTVVAHAAYMVAIGAGFGLICFFNLTKQAVLFLLGMVAQYVVYLLARGAKYIVKKLSKPKGM